MAKGTKKTPAKTSTRSKKSASKKQQRSLRERLLVGVKGFYAKINTRRRAFLARRSHRSFQLTRRRDYVRGLPLPGYISLTRHVFRTLRAHRKTILLLTLTYALIIIVVGGITSQDTYTQIKDLLSSSSSDIFGSGLGDIGKAGLLAVSAFAGLPTTLTVDQQIYLSIALVFAWLCTVWLLREYLLGRNPKLRDGLYNSGSPFLSTVMIIAIIGFQLIPLGIVAIIYAGLATAGIVDGGFSSMLFWVFAAMVGTLVAYWATSSLFALVIVTLPGMYPMRAMRMAGDIVLGRRLRILYRLLWGIGIVLLVWAVVMIPVIILNSLAGSAWSVVDNIPIVPFVGALLTAGSVVWYAAYVYLFYRKVVDNA